MTSHYISELAKMTPDILSDPSNPFFSALPDITEEDIDEAMLQMEEIQRELSRETDLVFEQRARKTVDRIKQKNQREKAGASFRANSDIIAFRVKTDVVNIQKCLDRIKNFFTDDQGMFTVKPLYKGNPDIIRCCFGYSHKYKYIVEFQVGHPFAQYTFARDSYIRDNITHDKVDLWGNNFYSHVQQKLLGQNPTMDVMGELMVLYGERQIEQELSEILEKL